MFQKDLTVTLVWTPSTKGMTVQTEGFRKSADYETDYFEALHHSNSHSMLAHLSGMSPGFRKRRRSYAASSALQDRMGPGGGDFDLGKSYLVSMFMMPGKADSDLMRREGSLRAAVRIFSV